MTRVVLEIPQLRSGSAGRPALPVDRPADAPLTDRFGRVATDLRVSLTDRCNLRCSYCLPPEGLGWKPDERLLGATTTLRTASGAAPQTAVTTNGLGLADRAVGLAASGLYRVNVPMDSLDRVRFARITHRDRLNDACAELSAATAAGPCPAKINTVLIRDVNDNETVPLLQWAEQCGYPLRFIEQMPLDPHGAWVGQGGRARDRRPVVPATRPAGERDRRVT